jgi:hypothetical protein
LLAWLKDHFFASILSIAAVIGAVQSIIKIFNVPEPYLVPTLLGLLFVGVGLFCLWLASDPKRATPDKTKTDRGKDKSAQQKEPASQFSPRVRRLAMLAVPVNVILGTLIVIATSPSTPRLIPVIRTFIANIDSARSNFASDPAAMTLYQSYRDARAAAHGEGFWTDIDLAMAVKVANVADHNHILQADIKGHIVPPQLTADSGRSSIAFGWVKDKKLESDLSFLTKYFMHADEVGDQVDSFRRGNLGDYENAKEFNQQICTYWELVLGDGKTVLTSTDTNKLRSAERSVRDWLRTKE